MDRRPPTTVRTGLVHGGSMVTMQYFCCTVSVCGLAFSALSALLWLFGSTLSSTLQPDSPFLLFWLPMNTPLARETPIVRPFPSVRVPVISGTSPFQVLWPLLTSGCSAVHHCMGCSGLPPLRLPSRPPQVRASNLRSTWPPHLHCKVRAVKPEVLQTVWPFGTSFCLANSSALQ